MAHCPSPFLRRTPAANWRWARRRRPRRQWPSSGSARLTTCCPIRSGGGCTTRNWPSCARRGNVSRRPRCIESRWPSLSASFERSAHIARPRSATNRLLNSRAQVITLKTQDVPHILACSHTRAPPQVWAELLAAIHRDAYVATDAVTQAILNDLRIRGDPLTVALNRRRFAVPLALFLPSGEVKQV